MHRSVMLAAWVTACFLGVHPSAAADDALLLVDVPGDSAGYVHDPQGPLIDVSGLAPGHSGSSDFAVRNASPYTATLVLTAFDVVEAENGCLPQEARAPGERCDRDGGELGELLRVTITRLSGAPTVLWSGGLYDLVDGAQLTDALAGGATWRLRATVALLWGARREPASDLGRRTLR